MTGQDVQLRLVQALSAGEWVSGANLAEAMGISREAVSKRVRKLAEWNLDVTSQSGRGYRLTPPLELLNPTAIEQGMASVPATDCQIKVVTSVDSTNRWLSENGAHRTLCLAEHQTAGRGRRGRQWHSPFAQNLYLSLRMDFSRWPDKLPALGLVVAVALCQRLNAQGIPLQLKWPNDLYLGGRKIGGLLIEQRGEMHGAGTLIVGLGLNVAMRDASKIDQQWTSLAREGYDVSRNALAATLAETLLRECEQLSDAHITMRLSQHSDFDLYRGQDIQIIGSDSIVKGQSRGIDEWGRLRLHTAQGERVFSVGDVSLRAHDHAPD